MEFKSAEHIYQYEKCSTLVNNTLAKKVMETNTAAEAKMLVKFNLSVDELDLNVWNSVNIEIMESILKAKAESYPLFKSALLESGDSLLVEATSDRFWGCGMSPSNVKNTQKNFFKGENKLGELLMKLRSDLVNVTTTPDTCIDVEQDDVSENTVFSTPNVQLHFDSPNASKSNDKVKPALKPKPTILKYFSTENKSNNELNSHENRKRQNSSPQENGPIPPGINFLLQNDLIVDNFFS